MGPNVSSVANFGASPGANSRTPHEVHLMVSPVSSLIADALLALERIWKLGFADISHVVRHSAIPFYFGVVVSNGKGASTDFCDSRDFIIVKGLHHELMWHLAIGRGSGSRKQRVDWEVGEAKRCSEYR